MGLSSVVALMERGINLIAVPQNVFESLDSFALLAIPFYVLAGNINEGRWHLGAAHRLASAAARLDPRRRGRAAILTCMFLSTISGSSLRHHGGGGLHHGPGHVVKKGYPKPFAAATVAVGRRTRRDHSPSLPMVIYGLVANVSIGGLFIAGIQPGIFIGLTLILTNLHLRQSQ